MDTLWYGLQVAVVGMLVVFVGLIILIGTITALKAVGKGKTGDAPEPEREAAAIAAPEPVVLPVVSYTPGPTITPKDDAFYAVVSAAVAAVLADEGVDPEKGFKITSVTAV